MVQDWQALQPYSTDTVLQPRKTERVVMALHRTGSHHSSTGLAEALQRHSTDTVTVSLQPYSTYISGYSPIALTQ